MDDCIFCKIVKGEIPSYKIHENESYLAFLDVNPNTDGHTLVIPKKHYKLVWDVEEIGSYFEFCQQVAKNYQKVMGNEFVYSIIHGEGVSHAHVHIIPSEDATFGKKLSEFAEGLNHPKLSDTKAKELVNQLKF